MYQFCIILYSEYNLVNIYIPDSIVLNTATQCTRYRTFSLLPPNYFNGHHSIFTLKFGLRE